MNTTPRFTATAYRTLMRLPVFKGRGRLEGWFRQAFLRAPVTRLPGGIVMELDALEWLQATILRDGLLEPETIRLLQRLLQPGDTYVDVGAHVGFHSLIARQCIGPDGMVIAVEPQPYNCAKLMANWRANSFKNLLLIVAACGTDRESGRIMRQQVASDSSRLTLAGCGVNDEARRFCVPVLRLGEVLREHAQAAIRLLKLDVEGHELAVLDGLEDGWERIEHIVLEVLDTSDGQAVSAMQIANLLSSHGFTLRDVRGGAWEPGKPLIENNLWASRPG